MSVKDLWTKDGPDGKKVPSARAGRGKRYRVTYNDTDGNEQTAHFAREVDANHHDLKMRSDVMRGEYIDPKAGKITLAEYGEQWLAAQTFDPNTRQGVEIRLRKHVFPALGPKQVKALAQRPSMIQAWLRGLQGDLSPGYTRQIFVNLSSIFVAAVDDGMILRNPCTARSVKAPTPEVRRVKPWSEEKVAAVAAGTPARYRASVDVGRGLGLRQGETFGLAVDDVDWLRLVVHVRRQVKLVGGVLVFALPKGDKERDVPLSSNLSLRLSAHLQAFPATAITLPWAAPDGRAQTHPLLFSSGAGKAMNRSYFNHFLWKPGLVAAGVIPPPRLGGVTGRALQYEESSREGFHQLRHLYASTLLSEGVDVRAVAEFLGHADPGFTLRVYGHLMPRSIDKARQVMDRIYDAAPTPAPTLSVVK